MQKIILAAICAAVAMPHIATAEITGAEVGLDYSGLISSGKGDTNKSTLGGSVEYGITPQFSLQGDLDQRYYGAGSWKGNTGTVHAIYHTYDGSAIGAFVGRDWMRGPDSNFYGVEGLKNFGDVRVEGFAGYVSGSDENKGGTYGMTAKYDLGNNWDVGGKFAMVDNDNNIRRLSATTTYAFPAGYSIDAELGVSDRYLEDKETFIGLGIRATFGGNNGVTFGGRGLQQVYVGN